MQVVNVKVNVGKDQKPKRRQAPRKKKVAGDSVMLHRGNPPSGGLPPPYPGYAPIGAPLRLAGPGQSYANLPGPLVSARYASVPSVMNPQASPAFIGSADELYQRNRNKNDDVRQIVNPSDITPIGQPSKRMVKSEPAPGAGYIPSASAAAEEASMGPAPFQGEVPRINEPDVSPSERAMPSQPSAGRQMMNAPSYPSEEEREEMMSEESEEDIPQAGVRRLISRPKKVMLENAGGEQSSMGGQSYRTPEPPILSPPGLDLMANPYEIQSDDVLLKMASRLGIVNAKERYRGQGFRLKLREGIVQAQQARGKQASMARGGRVKSVF